MIASIFSSISLKVDLLVYFNLELFSDLMTYIYFFINGNINFVERRVKKINGKGQNTEAKKVIKDTATTFISSRDGRRKKIV